MIVNIKTLPISILTKLPYSIKTYKDEYDLEELPENIQYMLTEYFKNRRITSSNKALMLDCYPNISEHGDFARISSMIDLICEYVKNYFSTPKGTYPFDVTWGCDLRKYIHNMDIAIKGELISNEVYNLAKSISSDLDVAVNLLNFRTTKTTSDGIGVDYNYYIDIKVGEDLKTIGLTIK